MPRKSRAPKASLETRLSETLGIEQQTLMTIILAKNNYEYDDVDDDDDSEDDGDDEDANSGSGGGDGGSTDGDG